MNKIQTKEKILFSFLILITILSWFTVLDEIAYRQNSQSLKETALTFAALQGVDSLISFSETIPVIGSLLKLYSNFLDQMTSILLVAFFSLGLQKIIIVAMQSFIINLLLSLNIFVVVLNGFKSFLSEGLATKLMKLALLMVFIRFAIPLMTITVNSLQVNNDEVGAKVSQERIEQLESKLLEIGKITKENNTQAREKKAEIELHRRKLSALISRKESLNETLSLLRFSNEESTFDKLKSLVVDSGDSLKFVEKTAPLRLEIMDINGQIKILSKKIDSIDDSSFFGLINFKEKIETVLLNLDNFASEIIDIFLMNVILFFFKNVLFPIVFLWVLYKQFDRVFSTNYSDRLENSSSKRLIVPKTNN